MFDNILGQENLKTFFKSAINNSKLSHAYLLHGISGIGKDAMALEIAKALNCQGKEKIPCGTCISCIKINKAEHPDVDYIFPVPLKIFKEKNKDRTKSICKS